MWARATSQLPNSRDKDPGSNELQYLAYNIHNSLFRIICRICKYSQIEPAFDAVTADDYNSMFISAQKLSIK
jgi:hypothetical protein